MITNLFTLATAVFHYTLKAFYFPRQKNKKKNQDRTQKKKIKKYCCIDSPKKLYLGKKIHQDVCKKSFDLIKKRHIGKLNELISKEQSNIKC